MICFRCGCEEVGVDVTVYDNETIEEYQCPACNMEWDDLDDISKLYRFGRGYESFRI